MKGSCKNNKCLAYQKDVWVQKGYGHFDFSRNSIGNVCPQCKTQMNSKSFVNIGYKNARVVIRGAIDR